MLSPGSGPSGGGHSTLAAFDHGQARLDGPRAALPKRLEPKRRTSQAQPDQREHDQNAMKNRAASASLSRTGRPSNHSPYSPLRRHRRESPKWLIPQAQFCGLEY